MKDLLAVIGSATFLIFALGSSSYDSDPGGTPSSPGTSAPGRGQVAQTAPRNTQHEAAKPDPSYSLSQMNAIRSAKSYLQMKGFSKKGLIEQLTSEYGDAFPEEDAVFAVNHIDVDWNEQAYRAAKSYLQLKGFSKKGLIEQLTSEHGDGFTRAQAEYGVKKAGF